MRIRSKYTQGPRALLSLAGAFILLSQSMACDLGMCANEEVQRIASPDGKLEAVIFERDCGATTDFSTQVSVCVAGGALANDGGNVFIADGDHGRALQAAWGGPAVEVRWLDNASLNISYDSHARVFAQHETVAVDGIHTTVRTMFKAELVDLPPNHAVQPTARTGGE